MLVDKAAREIASGVEPHDRAKQALLSQTTEIDLLDGAKEAYTVTLSSETSTKFDLFDSVAAIAAIEYARNQVVNTEIARLEGQLDQVGVTPLSEDEIRALKAIARPDPEFAPKQSDYQALGEGYELELYNEQIPSVLDRIRPIGKVRVRKSDDSFEKPLTPEENIANGYAPNGEPFNIWLPDATNSSEQSSHIWLRTTDGNFIQAIQQGQFVVEVEYSHQSYEVVKTTVHTDEEESVVVFDQISVDGPRSGPSHVPNENPRDNNSLAELSPERADFSKSGFSNDEIPSTYLVQTGESLWSISQRTGIAFQDLVDANQHLRDPSIIQPGEIINLSRNTEDERYIDADLWDATEGLPGTYGGYDFFDALDFRDPGDTTFGPRDSAEPSLVDSVSQTSSNDSNAGSVDQSSSLNALNGSLKSAYNLYTAIDGGDPFEIAGSSLDLVAAVDGFEGVGFDDVSVDGVSNINSSIGIAGSAWSFYEAIDRGDALGATGSGLALAQQGSALYASTAASTQAAASTAQAVSAGFGVAAGAFSVVTSAIAGDFIGMVAGVMMMIPGLQMFGFALAVANALGVFGDDPEPYVAPTGDGHFTRTGDDDIGISADGAAGNQGENVRASLAGRMGELQRHLSETPSGDELVRVALQQTLQELRAGLPEDAAIIPERLPSLSFNGYYYVAEYNDPDTAHSREIAIAPADVVDTLIELAHYTEAVAPEWEAEGVAVLHQAGDPQYWYTEEQHAFVGSGAGSAAAFMPIALDLSADGLVAANVLTHFDVDDDDYRELTQWIAPDDGLLVLDRDFDGRIDEASELFSNPALAAAYRGLGGLAWLDVNDDGTIDEHDPAFDHLRVWQDANADGISEAAELMSLQDAGITGLHYSPGSNPNATASAERTDGMQIGMAGVALAAEARGIRTEHRDGGLLIEQEGGETTFHVQDAIDLGPSEESSRGAPVNAKAILIDRDGVQRELRSAGEAAARATPFGEAGVGLLAFGIGFGNSQAAGHPSGNGRPVDPSGDQAATGKDGGIPGLLADPLLDPYDLTLAGKGSSATDPAASTEAIQRDGGSGTQGPSGSDSGTGIPAAVARASLEPTPNLELSSNVAPSGDVELSAEAPLEAPQVAGGEPLGGNLIGGPVAGDDTVTIPEDSVALITPAALLANDTAFSKTDGLAIADVRNPEHGTVSIGTDGLIRFVPERDFFGEARFEYVVSDSRGRTDVAIATVVVSPVNDVPVVSDEAVNILEDLTAVFAGNPGSHPLLRNDFDIEGDLLSISSVSSATHGVVNLTADNTVTFVPNANYFGTAQFDYTVDDGNGGTATATAFIDVLPVNDAPSFSGVDYTPGRQSGQVLASDVDNAPDDLRYAIEQHPLNGAASVDAITGMWSYSSTPCNPYFGADPFIVSVTDPDGDTDTIAVDTRHVGSTCNSGKKPLVIDLDGDGLEITGVDDSTVFFDVNDDGWREKIAWPGSEDGLIAFDKNDDGIISDYDEISFVSYEENARTDLEGLRAFDTNEDNRLSALDDDWESFGVWQDSDQDGLTDSGEFLSLDERGITGIDLVGQRQHEHFEDGSVLFGTTTFTTESGRTGTVGDIRLAYDSEDVVPVEQKLSDLVESPRSAAEAMDREEGVAPPCDTHHASELERDVSQLRSDMAGFESAVVGPEAVHFDAFEAAMLAESVDDVNDTAPY